MRRGFRTVEVVVAAEGLSEDEITELAEAFHRPDEATDLLAAAGLARRRHPVLQVRTTEEFFREVSVLLGDGVLPHGRELLLTEARRRRPGLLCGPWPSSVPGRRPDLVAAAEKLAAWVWGDVANEKGIFPPLGGSAELKLRWRQDGSDNFVPDSTLRRRIGAAGAIWRSTSTGGDSIGPENLTDSVNDLPLIVRYLSNGRLLILGEPGSGKTALLMEIAHTLLKERSHDQAIPVLIPMSSWSPPKELLRTWLATQLAIMYPILGMPDGVNPNMNVADALLTERLILPLLDGLDEIPPDLRDNAIMGINEAVRRVPVVVITCRSGDYRAATQRTDGVTVQLAAAMTVELCPLDAVEVTPCLIPPGNEARWAPVLADLDAPDSSPVALTLRTPLMVTLAGALYNRSRDGIGPLPPPAELCDRNRFPTQVTIEEHLLDGFVSACYRPDSPGRASEAERWLMFLAHHLSRDLKAGQNLAWWRLHLAVSPLLGAVVFGVLGGAITGVSGGVAYGPEVGLVTALAGVLSLGAWAWAQWRPPRPPACAVRWKVNRSRLTVCGALGLVPGGAAWIATGDPLGLALGSAIGPPVALAVGLLNGLGTRLATPVEEAAGPKALLVNDRAAFTRVVYLGGIALGSAGAIAVGGPVAAILAYEGRFNARTVLLAIAIGLAIGMAAGTAGGVAAGFSGGRWLVFSLARIWFSYRKLLPRDLMGFFEEAYSRGIFRRVGGFYQFRHEKLQHRLAARYAQPPKNGGENE